MARAALIRRAPLRYSANRRSSEPGLVPCNRGSRLPDIDLALGRRVGRTHALNDHCREPRAFVTRFENSPCGAARTSKRVGLVVERAQSRIDQGLPELLESWPTGVPSFRR